MYVLFASLTGLLLYANNAFAEQSRLTVVNEWNTGFTASFGLKLQSKVTNGWVIILTFSKPALKLQTWVGDIIKSVSSDRKRYVITNKPWQKELSAGYALKTDVVLAKAVTDSPAPSGVAMFQRLGSGAGGNTGGGGGAGGGIGGGGGGGENTGGGGGGGVIQPTDLPSHQHLVHTTTMKFCGSPFCSMKRNAQEDFPPQIASLGGEAQHSGTARGLG